MIFIFLQNSLFYANICSFLGYRNKHLLSTLNQQGTQEPSDLRSGHVRPVDGFIAATGL